jgi:hypothetical protein
MTIALVHATPRPGSVGSKVLSNLTSARFEGPTCSRRSDPPEPLPEQHQRVGEGEQHQGRVPQ